MTGVEYARLCEWNLSSGDDDKNDDDDVVVVWYGGGTSGGGRARSTRGGNKDNRGRIGFVVKKRVGSPY